MREEATGAAPCMFCGLNPSAGTMTRRGPDGEVRLRLCARCMDLAQFVQIVHQAETVLGQPACTICGALADRTAQLDDPTGQFLGRLRLCPACALHPAVPAILRTATAWTPGVVDLPPMKRRAEGLMRQVRPAPRAEKKAPPPPRPESVDSRVALLEHKLNEAVANEEYLAAARLRDEIRRLREEA